MTTTRLAGGTVIDPANGPTAVRDVWVRGGIVVAPPADGLADRTFDVSGLAVMPGGVDIHAHVAGPKVNTARKLRPEDRRDSPPLPRTPVLRGGTLGSTPTTFATGYLYAGLGYTTVFDAAVPPLSARHAHEEFHDTPLVDKGFYVLAGNNHYVLEQVRRGEHERLRHFLAWLLTSTRGYALKVVNPGGVEAWKQGAEGLIGLDDTVPGFDLSPRQVVRAVATAADELNLPHPVHVHCNRLGLPGNWRTTLDTMRAVEGRRAHFTHVQFHSYGGGGGDDQAGFRSEVPALADYVNSHPNISVDVGQVVFGETTSMTGDGPLGHYLHKVTGRKWFNGETECEAGCGIVPITYREASFVHALQWAIGLEWYLLVDDPWRVAMSTDHPNGGAFRAYPEIVALLMSRDLRRDVLARLPAKVRERSTLADIAREYTLAEVAVVTRAGPARMLGLRNKGHLGVGADADVAVYTPADDKRAMFELPRMVFKAGALVLENGEIRVAPFGPTHAVAPAFDPAVLPGVKDWFERHYSVRFGNYPVTDDYLPHGVVVNRTPGARPS